MCGRFLLLRGTPNNAEANNTVRGCHGTTRRQRLHLCIRSFRLKKSSTNLKKKKVKSNFYLIMEPCHKSRRLQGLEPEISTTTFRCFCLLDGDTCATTATLLPCCRQFIHKVCQEQWIRAGHNHCAMCRQRLPRQTRIPFPDPDMTVPQVVERLSRLLATQALIKELDEVSASFFSGI